MIYAPIVLFVYNRPWHTEQTLRALMANDLAAESELFIYADGAKPNADADQLQRISDVRALIRREQWCGKVHIIEFENNKGLANSIITGVTEVINQYNRVIVLEDDLVVSTSFLLFMNKALEYYEYNDGVFSISSDIPMKMPDISPYPYDVFVSYRNFSYGWGTWGNRWKLVDWSVNDYEQLKQNPYMQYAFCRGGDDLLSMLESQRQGKIDSWAIRFTWAHFVRHAVSIMPTQSFVHHLGFDGSGIHCSGNIQDGRILNVKTEYKFLPVLYEDSRFINAFYNTYYHASLPVCQRIVNKICRIFWGRNLFAKMGKVFVK